ncbi:MAG: translation initiation factor IF-2 [Planctomycetaceae bacterium]|nr:translation initiation factor IF-2 [Planctomycetaceae bacterium]
MSIRIYALAQQLKVETKKLIDVLKQVGIEGKGSSLASLTEEEVEKVKTAVQKTQVKSSKSGGGLPDAMFKRPSVLPTDKKVRVLEPHTKKETPPPQSTIYKDSKEKEIPVVSAPPVVVAPPPESKTGKKEKEPDIVPSQEPAGKKLPEKKLPPKEPPVKALPTKELPAKGSPIKELPAKGLPPKELPAKGLPTKESSAKGLPTKELPAKGLPTKELPAKGLPTKELPAKGLPPKESSAKDSKLPPKELPAKESPVKGALPSFPTLPPPLGHIELTPSSEPKGGTSKKSAPLNAFLKKTDSSSSTPASPITTGLSEPGHAIATRRDDYKGPMSGKILNLDALRKKPQGNKPSSQPPSKPTGPSIRIAPVPKTPTPKTPKVKEPTPQKPDMVLPKDVIRSAIATGTSKELENHILKHEERQRAKELERKSKDLKKQGKVKGKGKTPAPPETEEHHGKGGRNLHQRGGTGTDIPLPLVEEAKKKRRSGATRRNNRNDFEEEVAVIPRQLKRQRNRGRSVSTAAPRKADIVIQLPCSVKQFAEQTGLSVPVVIKKLLEMGTPMMINSQLDRESSELLAEAFEIRMSVRDQVSLEDRLVVSLFEEEDPPESLKPRPPVVTVLGHVDHGKTTLLDYILHLNVVSGEKGGITQHIRAYRVKMENGEDITFVDTPGHEAFTEMRARGANCTDIVVLVVAADDGVMPQTEEAISHAKAAGVPIIVALNKMDLPGVNSDRVIQELAAHELMPSEWGGDVEVIRCSGLTGLGIDKLLETIQVTAELHELKANPNRSAIGVALEAELQSGQGVICKMLVQNGTLRTGDVVLCGTAYGRVKAMYDTLDAKKMIGKAAPSTPVHLIGLNTAPSAGSKFCVLEDISDARTIAEQRLDEERKNILADVQSHVTLETLFQRINSAQTTQTLNVIIRADVRGSIEAIRKELGKLDHPEVKIKILQATVGGISEADVQLADASDAIIVGFNVVPDENARIMADRKKIQIRRYDIIYNLTDDIKKALEGMLKPIEQVKELGRALVQRVFVISRLGVIAGCRVISGIVERDCRVRIIRESRIIGDYPLDSLKREKDDVKEVREGYECGMKLKGFNDLKEGDILETYKIEEIARTF